MQADSHRHGHKRREAKTFARASISSAAATALDGTVYQALLFVWPGQYVIAAFLAAIGGAVTNFTLNRYWAFPRTWKALGLQVWLYAFAAAATYGGLQFTLWLLIEVFEVHERTAWLPAKGFAWLFISYPLNRFVVFGRGAIRG